MGACYFGEEFFGDFFGLEPTTPTLHPIRPGPAGPVTGGLWGSRLPGRLVYARVSRKAGSWATEGMRGQSVSSQSP